MIATHLNRRLRPDAVKFGALDLNPTWTPRANYVSQRYTTHWQELPTVRPSTAMAHPITPRPAIVKQCIHPDLSPAWPEEAENTIGQGLQECNEILPE